MKLLRRNFLHLAAGAAALPAVSRIAWAQAYPSRPVTLIVFVPAGGAPDISARLAGQSLSQRLGPSVVIDNRPGAGGNLALQAVARAPADGYTLLLVATPHAINVTLYEKSNVSVTHDMVPVAGILIGTFVMLGSPSLPAKTLPEFIAYAKANPGKINMTSSGAGNLSHLAGELFKMMTGIDVVHVPYKGAVPAHAGLMAGDVHIMFDAMTSALPQIQSGRLRALGRCRTSRLSPSLSRATRLAGGWVLALQGARRAKWSTGSTRRSMRSSPIPRSWHGLPTWAVNHLPARPLISAVLSPQKPRSGAR
jgi:tripartite-type tricarboxylate transporter receptor subunit TctC